MSANTPIRVGVIGLGGYAFTHHLAILRLEKENQVRLVCTCDPQCSALAESTSYLDLAGRGVEIFDDYRAMLRQCANQLDLVVIPTPLALHAEMHSACVEAGIACYLEKPPTLFDGELEQMIEVDRRASKQTLVGFNFIIEPARLALKQRILDGEFGAIQSATLLGFWNRPGTYFRRNDWSGRLLIGNRIILDSCFGNALSHFVYNLLFWVGNPTLISWGTPTEVRAQLYRAHVIEGADTFFVETLVNGVLIRLAVSHACRERETNTETVVCEKATIRFIAGHSCEILWNDGRYETVEVEPFDTPLMNHLDYHRYLRGETNRPAVTLEDCRAFVHLNDLTYISSGTIENVSAEFLLLEHVGDHADVPVIACLTEHSHSFLNDGVWPQFGARTTSGAPFTATSSDLPRLRQVLLGMTSSARNGHSIENGNRAMELLKSVA